MTNSTKIPSGSPWQLATDKVAKVVRSLLNQKF